MAKASQRGWLLSKNGEQQFLVLRGSTLRVFSAETKKRKIGLPDVILRLDYAEVEALTGQRFEVRTQTPSKASHVFQAKSEEKTREWVMNLSQHIAETKTRFDQYIQILTEGGTAYKYNYSNSKRMRRHFWVDLQKVELCWSKAKSEGEEPQMMSLRDSVGLIYGPMTTTFQRCENLEDLPWTCFSILFSDRTLDMAVPSQMESWFLGLQFYLIGRSNCVSCITEAQFVFRRVYHKLSTSAHKHVLGIVWYLNSSSDNQICSDSLRHWAGGIVLLKLFMPCVTCCCVIACGLGAGLAHLPEVDTESGSSTD